MSQISKYSLYEQKLYQQSDADNNQLKPNEKKNNGSHQFKYKSKIYT